MIVIIRFERGIPSKCESSARADYVPALCTHRPSLLPIGWSGENVGFCAISEEAAPQGAVSSPRAGKVVQTLPSRGRRSRNKVSVGEPAEGSLTCFLSLPLGQETKTKPKPFAIPGFLVGGSLLRGLTHRKPLFPHKSNTTHPNLHMKVSWKALFALQDATTQTKNLMTFNGGSLGSCIDEERCELRYVM